MRAALLTLLLLWVSLGRLEGHVPQLPVREARAEAQRGAPIAEAIGSREVGWLRAVVEEKGPAFSLEALRPPPLGWPSSYAFKRSHQGLPGRQVVDWERALFVAIGYRLSRAPPAA